MAEQIPWDWLSAQQRLGQGRISDPSQDRISASDMPDWWWEQQRYRERQTPGLIERPEDVSALPFGDLADPVSQAAFLMAPGMVRGSKALLESLDSPSPSLMRRGMLGSQRGNLGPPPVSATGEALPESMVRDETGQLQRLYHGTSRVFPDFDMAKAGSGAGGDLYGPGIYMTNNPEVAGGLADVDTIASQLGYATSGNSRPQFKILGEKLPSSKEAWRILEEKGLASDTHIDPSVIMEHRAGGYYVAQRIPDAPNVRPVYANLKRPFDINGVPSMQDKEALIAGLKQANLEPLEKSRLHAILATDNNYDGQTIYNNLERFLGNKDATNTLLQNSGFDGITHIGGSGTGGQPHRVYIAFSPEHVYPSVNVDALRGMSTKMK